MEGTDGAVQRGFVPGRGSAPVACHLPSMSGRESWGTLAPVDDRLVTESLTSIVEPASTAPGSTSA